MIIKIREVSNQRQSPGFTLLELLVVIVIIGMLASYVAPRYFSQLEQSEVKVARSQISAFDKALDQYRLDTGHYPTTEQGLQVLMTKPPEEKRWNGPYLKSDVPPDPWGNTYQYRKEADKNREYVITSLGSDGKPGGEDTAADITN